MIKINKILIILMFIMILFSIGAVSAADVNSTDDKLSQNITEENFLDSSFNDVELNYDLNDEILEDDEKIDAEMNITYDGDLIACQANTIKILMPEDADGLVCVSYYSDLYYEDFYCEVNLIDGKGEFEYIPHDTGKFPLEFKYQGNEIYNEHIYYSDLVIRDFTLSFSKNSIPFEEEGNIYLIAPYSIKGVVSITINGKQYSSYPDVGYYRFYVDNFVLGENEVNIYYAGDGPYHAVNKTVSINTYERQDPKINITCRDDIKACEPLEIFFEVPDDIEFSFDPFEYDDGIYEWIDVYWYDENPYTYYYVPTQMGKEYKLIFRFYGDDKYNPQDIPLTFTTNDYTINLMDEVIIHYPEVELELRCPDGFSGQVTVTINDKNYSVNTENTFLFTVDNLIVGDNQVKIRYDGDDVFHQVDKNVTLTTIFKKDPEINITVPEKIMPGFYYLINVTCPEDNDIVLNIEYYLDDYGYWEWEHYDDITLTNGKGVFNFYTSSMEKCQFYLYYPESDIYKSKSVYFNITPNDFEIKPSNEQISFYSDYLIFFNPIERGFNVTVNGDKYSLEDYESFLSLRNNLKYGENEVNVYFKGDDTYHEFNKTYIITAYGEIEYETYGLYNTDDGYVKLRLPDDANGKLVLKSYEINGNESICTEILSKTIEDGYVELNLKSLPVQEKSIIIEYVDDDKYNVEPIDTILRIEPKISSHYYTNGTVEITIETTPNAEFNVTPSYYVDYYHSYFPFEDFKLNKTEEGFTKIQITGMNEDLSIEVTYQDGDFEYSYYDYLRFIAPVEITLSIKNNTEILPSTSNFDVNFNRSVEGNVIFLFDGEEKFNTYCYHNSQIQISLDDCTLSYGNHTIEVIYYDEAQTISKKINVTVSNIKIDIPEFIPANDEYVYEYTNYALVSTAEGVTGKVTYKVDGKILRTVEVNENQNYYFYLNSLDLGFHDVEIIFSQDDVNNLSKTQRVYVDYVLNLKNNYLSYAKQFIEVCMGNYSDLTIKIDDVEYDYTRNGAYAKIDEVFSIGNHDITVESGDEVLLRSNFYVYGEVVYESDYDEMRLVLPEDSEGSLKITVYEYNPETYQYDIKDLETEVALVNGKAAYSFFDFIEKDYVFIGEYLGEDYSVNGCAWYQYSNGCKFKIDNSTFKTIENTTARVHVQEGVEGYFYVEIFKMGGLYRTTEEVNIKNNSANITIANLPEGSYVLEFKVKGSINDQRSFNIEVIPMDVDLKAKTNDIFEGETATVNITLPSDVTGTVIVKLDGKEILSQKANETMSINLNDLKIGAHGIEAILTNDAIYASNSTFVGLIVKEIIPVPVDSNMNISIGNNSVTIEIPEDATGNITVKVDGRIKYDGNTVNKIEFGELSVGLHIIEVAYTGDDKYSSASMTEDVNVAKETAVVSAEDSVIAEGDSALVRV